MFFLTCQKLTVSDTGRLETPARRRVRHGVGGRGELGSGKISSDVVKITLLFPTLRPRLRPHCTRRAPVYARRTNLRVGLRNLVGRSAPDLHNNTIRRRGDGGGARQMRTVSPVCLRSAILYTGCSRSDLGYK